MIGPENDDAEYERLLHDEEAEIAYEEEDLAAKISKAKRSECDACEGTGVFHSGVCHCGEEMDKVNTLFAHDNHMPTEMVGPCPYCEEDTVEEEKEK